MQKIIVEKEKLLEQLQANLSEHRRAFQDAEALYRKEVVRELRKRANDIVKGESVDLYFSLPKPEDHSEDFEAAIAMMEWHVETEVELDQTQFNNWVLNRGWQWERAFLQNTLSYTSAANL